MKSISLRSKLVLVCMSQRDMLKYRGAAVEALQTGSRTHKDAPPVASSHLGAVVMLRKVAIYGSVYASQI